VGSLALGKRELSVQVLGHGGGSGNSLKQSGINSLLVCLALGKPFLVNLGSALLGGEEFALAFLGGGSNLDALKVGVVDVSRDVHGRDVNLGGGGDHVRLVDAAQGHTVHLVRACGRCNDVARRGETLNYVEYITNVVSDLKVYFFVRFAVK
jgi:hypothetical protein